MSEEEFNGERLMPTKVELGLVAILAVIVGSALLFGVEALVAVGVVLATVVLVLMILLARGGPTSSGGG